MKLFWLATVIGVIVGTASAAPALARPHLSFTIYKVRYEGAGTYHVKQVDPPAHSETTATFKWDVTYTLAILHKAGEQVTGLAKKGASKGVGGWSISSDNGGGDACSKRGDLKITPNGAITGHVENTGSVNLQLVPGGGGATAEDYITTNGASNGHGACDTKDYWHQWVQGFSHVGTGGSQELDPLTAFVKLSRTAQRAGKVVFNVSNQLQPALIPDPSCGESPGGGASCSQSFKWSGHVTLTKTKSVKY